jgi:hypothetical protein
MAGMVCRLVNCLIDGPWKALRAGHGQDGRGTVDGSDSASRFSHFRDYNALRRWTPPPVMLALLPRR